MNAWQKQQMDQDPSGLTEICDCCEREILHWDWMCRSFLDFDGKIHCSWCRSETLQNRIQNKEFHKLAKMEVDITI